MGTRSGRQIGVISSGLILALLLNPFCCGQQEGTSAKAAPDSSGQPAQTQSLQEPANGNVPNSSETLQPEPQPDQQIPDSPGTVQQRVSKPSPQQSPPVQSPQNQEQPVNTPHEPLGTAAAESVPTSGVAASRPAGAALAPAKQRRVRSILIKVGALVGVGVAIGTTMALSQGSPSKPPGTN